VPKYIPAGVSQLFGSATHNALFAITDGAPNRLYVYNFYWTDQNVKAQSAWTYWEFDPDVVVLSGNVVDNAAYVLLKRADGAYLEKIQLEMGAVAPTGLPYQIFLDRRVPVTGTFLSSSNVTEFVLPYPVADAVKPSFRIVRGGGWGALSGSLYAIDPAAYTWVFPNVVRIAGNQAVGSVLAGNKFEQRFRFSQQFMLSYRDRTAITTGRMMMRTWTVYFTDTAYFRTEVAPYGLDAVIEDFVPSEVANFDAKTLGQSSLLLGSPVLATGTYTFGVQGDSKVAKVDIVNDTPYAATFTQAEFEGFYFNRAQTI
jgi:putative cofactor-binding repeat protein